MEKTFSLIDFFFLQALLDTYRHLLYFWSWWCCLPDCIFHGKDFKSLIFFSKLSTGNLRFEPASKTIAHTGQSVSGVFLSLGCHEDNWYGAMLNRVLHKVLSGITHASDCPARFTAMQAFSLLKNPSSAQVLSSVAPSHFQHESMSRKKYCSNSLALCCTLIFYHCRTGCVFKNNFFGLNVESFLQTTKLQRRGFLCSVSFKRL